MTEQNTEELEGFEDIWSTILDERVLLKLEEKVQDMRTLILKEAEPKDSVEDREESKSEPEESESEGAARKRKDAVEPESPTNFKLIDGTIRSPSQRNLYKQFMSDTKRQNTGLKFDLFRVEEEKGQPS